MSPDRRSDQVNGDPGRGETARFTPAGSDTIGDRILYEDNHLIAVSKRCGEITQGDRTGDMPLGELIAIWIKERDRKPGNVYITPVHRLDRPVSGVSIYAKSSKATSRMNELFRSGRVEKRYRAIVAVEPPRPEDRLVHYLFRNPKLNKSFANQSPSPGAKRSELGYRVVARSDRYVLLEVAMESGRHHQIRAQLAAIGCPIRGDLKYGYRRSNPGGGISLHAFYVAFEHPVGKGRIEIVASPPEEDRLWRAFEGVPDSCGEEHGNAAERGSEQ